ncbi:FIG00453152: hypothetical protein [Cronobacter turicensis 564]|nr:FIG00453152: hypothetical protein [Cronobacter turicensis 564]
MVESISDLISFAAWALRLARLRTSPATTAKPRPCSPARAASTEAFSARMLVWNAMPSMTLVISPIFAEALSISCMVEMALDTTSPPREAASVALCAWVLACAAASVELATDAVISSTALAVSRRLEAACSVRPERSWFPAAISFAATFTEALASRSWPITPESLSQKALKAWAICATSSRPSSGRRCDRSLVPLLIATSASRIISRRFNSFVTRKCISAPVINSSTSTEIAEVLSRARMPDVASFSSSAMTRYHWVPGTGVASKAFCAPPISPSSAVSLAFSSLNATPDTALSKGFDVSAGSFAAISVPSSFTSSPLLFSVG